MKERTCGAQRIQYARGQIQRGRRAWQADSVSERGDKMPNTWLRFTVKLQAGKHSQLFIRGALQKQTLKAKDGVHGFPHLEEVSAQHLSKSTRSTNRD